jgi:hypothetical protein
MRLYANALNFLKNSDSVFSFQLFRRLKELFLKKNFLLSRLQLDVINNSLVYLQIIGFVQTRKLSFFKKSLKKQKCFVNKKKDFRNLLISLFKNVSVNFSIKILNQHINKRNLRFFFHSLKRFESLLFGRSFVTFIDFMKAIDLVGQRKMSLYPFVHLLGKVFSTLTKRKHSKFNVFVVHVFDLLLSKYKNIKGIKMVLNGRLSGKTRASTVKITRGSSNLNSISADHYYVQTSIYTQYGAFGLKLWITYSKKN